jgi:hypothetical protein
MAEQNTGAQILFAVPQNLLCDQKASVGRVGLERSGRPYRDHGSGFQSQFCAIKPRLGLDTHLRRYSTGGAQVHQIASVAPLFYLFIRVHPYYPCPMKGSES